jgi:CxxC motif-containing protein
MKELICIMCPKGCHLTVDDNLNVTGNSCPRGAAYGKQEVIDPRRYLTSTVRLESKYYSRLPVISSGDLPKDKVSEVIKYLDTIVVKAPVKVKDVIVENVLGLGVDIVATRTIKE